MRVANWRPTYLVWRVNLKNECIDSAYLCRQVEDKDAEEWDEHGGQDQVDRVEQGLSPHRNVKGYVQIRLITASVKFFIPETRQM